MTKFLYLNHFQVSTVFVVKCGIEGIESVRNSYHNATNYRVTLRSIYCSMRLRASAFRVFKQVSPLNLNKSRIV